MSAPLLTPLLVGLLIASARGAQQDSGIVNGKKAKPHSRLYMVSVQQGENHKCGGFLVSGSFVMTAAHCWDRKEQLTVLLGAHNIYDKKNSIRARVAKYHVHPRYSYKTLENDIMLLQLKTAVQKSRKVAWIPLPVKDEDIKPKTVCSVAGWGAIKTKGSTESRLREADVSVVDRAVCNETWGGRIRVTMMCAGGSAEKGFCQGDSGGPLVCDGKAVGIVSYNGEDLCDYPSKLPNVYTQISKFLPWINKTINKKPTTTFSFFKR